MTQYMIMVVSDWRKVDGFLYVLRFPTEKRDCHDIFYDRLAFGKHSHDRIIWKRVEVYVYKTSLTLPLYIEVPVPSQESERSYIW